MKLLFLLHETSVSNGSWHSAYLLLEGLKKKGVDILVITPDKKEAYNQLKLNGYKVQSVRYFWPYEKKIIWNSRDIILFFPRLIRRKLYDVFNYRKLKKISKNFNPDIIHSNSSVLLIGHKLAQKFKIPHIWHIREYGQNYDFNIDLRHINKILSKEEDYTICISKDIQKFRKLDNNKKSKVFYNGFILNFNIVKKEKLNYYLHISSLTEGKGIDSLLQAWNKFKLNDPDNNVELIICGGSQERIENWKKYIKNFDLKSDGIKFLGKVDNVAELMQKAKAFIFPSYQEGFGRVMVESQINNCIVIGRNTGGIKEQFNNGKLLNKQIGIPFNDVQDLVDILIKFEKDDFNKSKILEDAKFTVSNLYNIEDQTDQIYKYYRDIINKDL